MTPDAKKRIAAAVDALAAEGHSADALHMHPDTARECALHATHLDLGSDAWAPSAAGQAAELCDPGYDARGAHDPHPGGALSKPHAPEQAATIAGPRCQAALRRPGVKLAVTLDPSMEPGKMSVTGPRAGRAGKEA
jgi:hypothetical protein